MFGLSFDKLLLIGVLAAFIVGPKRLPGYAAKLGQLVRNLRVMADGARDRMRQEMGPEFDEIDWKKLDPRQYDPRRIIRDALTDDPPQVAAPTIGPAASSSGVAAVATTTVIGASGVAASAARKAARSVIPFDTEAT